MEFTCFVHPSWAPRIRPASKRRAWMDATAETFAYRCLPLAIANAHGWVIGSACGFEARWNGGEGVDAVEIRTDPGTANVHAPVSLFGYGTLTFHVEGLIRTSPGWNLWVGGAPNDAKDGIAPLGGLIESDWSPYSFTMNWRFTRPGQWVRWEIDEPFCFFFPVERGVLDAVEPKLLPLSDDPELEAAFTAWSASRDAFQEHVRQTRPEAPADRWQKLYYRGICPNGAAGARDHQAKLRLAPFTAADGTCPIPPEPPAKAIPARPGPGVAASPIPAPRDLARRDWILQVAENQRALSPLAGGISRVADISAEEFLDHFYAPGRPAVIEGEMLGWPILERWTPDYLAKLVGPAEVEYQGARGSNADFEIEKDKHKQRMPFDAFIASLGGGKGNDAYLTAYNSAANQSALAPMLEEMHGLPKFLTAEPGMLWIGPGGTFTPLHFDLTNNLLAQVVGEKRLILLPPSETAKLANSRHVFSEVHDLTDPERLALHPMAKRARFFDVTLSPGELLYIPVGWWHQVTSLSFSVMLTYTNFHWPNDAHASFPPD